MIRPTRLCAQLCVFPHFKIALSQGGDVPAPGARKNYNHRVNVTELQSSRAVSAAAEKPPGKPGVPGNGEQGERGVAVAEAEPLTKVPPLYRVLLLNDDYTPMEFVVDVLERFFAMNRSAATRVMLEVHTRGKGICGVFTYEIAETKVSQVMAHAREHQHPLMCTLEQA
jgi:ATP-dependent Clp protease adaptor protein ClpS